MESTIGGWVRSKLRGFEPRSDPCGVFQEFRCYRCLVRKRIDFRLHGDPRLVTVVGSIIMAASIVGVLVSPCALISWFVILPLSLLPPLSFLLLPLLLLRAACCCLRCSWSGCRRLVVAGLPLPFPFPPSARRRRPIRPWWHAQRRRGGPRATRCCAGPGCRRRPPAAAVPRLSLSSSG